jgi:hypothetical protein
MTASLTMKTNTKVKEAPGRTPVVSSHAEISARAAALWRQRGCPQARDSEIWLEAERQLSEPPKSDAKGRHTAGLIAPGSSFSSVDVMNELDEEFPSPDGRATTSL